MPVVEEDEEVVAMARDETRGARRLGVAGDETKAW